MNANGDYSAFLKVFGFQGNIAMGSDVNTLNPSYTLTIKGSCGAQNFVNTSDIRKKDVIENIDGINIEDIANSPIFTFKWKDDKDCATHIGTSAQYWKGVLPNAVYEANDDIGTLSMEYGTASLASVISLAKKTVELEKRIKVLEGN